MSPAHKPTRSPNPWQGQNKRKDPVKTYPLTPTQLNQLRTRLLELGVTLPDGQEGVLIHGGIQLKYFYSPETTQLFGPNQPGVLTLSIVKKPLVVPAAAIWAQVGGWIDDATKVA